MDHMSIEQAGAVASEDPVPTAHCPVCQSGRIVPFMIVADNGHLRRTDVRLPVHRCRDCDTVFLNPPPPAHVGREYFAEAYADERKGNIYYDDAFKERVSRLRLEVIGRFGKSSGRLLDVGCGKGQFVATARSVGFDAWGVELDAGACRYAATRLGLSTVRHGSLDHPGLPSDFDVVTLWDVIEHVPDPVEILRGAAWRLVSGGFVVVRTANIRSWAFERHRAQWWAFGSDHRFYFSPGSLSAAMTRAGLRVTDVLDCEPTERPEKTRKTDISETRLGDGLATVVTTPAKLGKVGRYLRNRLRKRYGEWRYGRHFHTAIMTVIARRL